MNADSQGGGNKTSDDLLIQHWVKRGVELQNAARFEWALSCFVKALELDPNRVSIWYNVGNCWQNLGLFEDAIASYNACYQRSQTQQNQWLQAASQFRLGQCYVSLEQQDDAVSAYSLAYQLFGQIGNNPHTQEPWDYLNWVGNCWLDQKNYQASIPYYQRLLKLVKSVNNSQHLGWVWHGLGRGFSGDCLDELGLECHRQMLGISRNLSDWEMEGTALYWLAWESWTLKKLADAIAYYESAIAVYEGREEGKGWVSVILDYLANLYQQTEDFEKAIAVLERGLAIVRESQDKSREYGLLYQIGGVFYKLKDYDRALEYYQSALEVAQGLTERQPGYEANAYYMLGVMCEFLGRLEEGLANYREGLRLYGELGNQEWVDYSHQKINSLEELLARRASFSQSESDPQLNFLLDVLQATQDSKGDAKVVYPLLEQNLDQLNENLADILRAWATAKFKEVPTETAAYIAGYIATFSSLILQFPLGQRADNLEIAIACYQAALEVRTRSAFPQYWADTQNNLGNAYKDCIRGERADNMEEAIRCYQGALEVRTRTAFPYNYVQTSFNLGITYQQLKQWQLAYDTFDNAIETVEDIRAEIVKGGDSDKQKLAEEWQKLYQRMVEVCIEQKNYTAAIEYVDRSKTRNLVELIATRDLYPKGDIPQTVLDKLTDLRQNIETEQRRLEIEERNRDNFGGGTMGERSANITTAPTSPPDRSHLNQLQQQLDDLINNEITPIDPDFRRTQKVQPMPFAEIQALTGENTAILEWYILSDRFLAFIVTPPTKPTGTNGETVTLWQSSKEDYNQLVKWADDYLNAYRNRTSQDWQNSLISRLQKLGEILHINELMATIEKTAKKCDRLVLIPNRFLHLFPLHAIPISVSGGDITYLMDRFSGGVSYAPSCQLLQTANNRDRQNFSELFAIQNPTEDLEFTNLEVRRISTYFNPQTTLVKKQATKTELNSQQKTTLKTAHCHHFSCHGYFNFANPLLSALLLANCYLQPPPDPIDRSRHLPLNNNKTVDLSECLTLGDVFTLDLRSCRLVTLSACETGLIDILSNSDEYIGLPSGFLVAGSTNVVSSLWAVSDISTALLMIRFYEVFWEVKNVAIALNYAQNWLRNATKTELLNWGQSFLDNVQETEIELMTDNQPFSSPYYWAAFCAVGKVT
ncbi:CHAT domain-containing protein [Limnospira platensis CENA597]|uniref:CHAT domain-containing protein n=1 Tax=Limnospira platensis TaxID=118562 RepID=UPI003DA0AEE5